MMCLLLQDGSIAPSPLSIHPYLEPVVETIIIVVGLRVGCAFCGRFVTTRHEIILIIMCFARTTVKLTSPPSSPNSPTRLFLFRWSCNMSKCCFRNRKNNIWLFITTCFCSLLASTKFQRISFVTSNQVYCAEGFFRIIFFCLKSSLRRKNGLAWREEGTGESLKNLNDSRVNGYEVDREMNVFEFSFHFFSLPSSRRHHDDDFLL